jgi:E3 SUMO-protein ligase PIAS1
VLKLPSGQTFRYNIRLNTVDKLKHIVNGLNEECYVSLSKSGRKQELIDRITDQLLQWKAGANIDKWNKAKTVINQVRTSGM